MNFSNFQKICAHLAEGSVFPRLIHVPVLDKSTSIVFWKQKGPFCGFATYLNAFQIQNLTALASYLDNFVSLTDKLTILDDLNGMLNHNGFNVNSVKLLAKYTPQINLKYTPLAVLQKFKKNAPHLMALLHYQVNMRNAYILLDPNTTYKPAVIYQGFDKLSDTQLNTLLKPLRDEDLVHPTNPEDVTYFGDLSNNEIIDLNI